MVSTPVIRMRDLSFSYDGSPVVEVESLDILEGQFVTVVGPNGGGKTTLLKLVLGLMSPVSGSIAVFGSTPVEARPRIGYVPQHAHTDPGFPASVLDVVLMGRLGRVPGIGRYRWADVEAAARALEDVELLEQRNRSFGSLSGGERQRALIARALSSQPELLLLDEPTASLDIAMENELYEILRTLRERLTVLMASHDLAFVSDFTDTVVCVRRSVAVHTTSEVTPELINELYGRDVRFVRHDLNDHAAGGCR